MNFFFLSLTFIHRPDVPSAGVAHHCLLNLFQRLPGAVGSHSLHLSRLALSPHPGPAGLPTGDTKRCSSTEKGEPVRLSPSRMRPKESRRAGGLFFELGKKQLNSCIFLLQRLRKTQRLLAVPLRTSIPQSVSLYRPQSAGLLCPHPAPILNAEVTLTSFILFIYFIIIIILMLFIYLFVYWLRWVFVAVHGLSLVVASGGHSSL